MSGKNPFYIGDDDMDSNGGGYRSNARYDSGFGRNNDSDTSRQSSTQSQIQASRERQLESQKNILRNIYDSERVGVATAEELIDQGERLRRTEQRLDDIGQMQNSSQRSLNNLKSVFGGVKNWWNKGKNEVPGVSGGTVKPAASQPYTGASRLQDAAASSASAQSKVDLSGFYSVERILDGLQQQQQQTKSAPRDKEFDSNVDEMSNGMARLKQLALGLGDEIETQNKDLERLGTKMETVNDRMDSQNQQMRTILYGTGGKKK